MAQKIICQMHFIYYQFAAFYKNRPKLKELSFGLFFIRLYEKARTFSV